MGSGEFFESGAHIAGERDFGAGFFVNGDVNGFAGADDLFLLIP